MELLGMPEAARRMGVSTLSARRALLNAGVPLIRVNERAYAVTAENFAAFLAARQAVGYKGRGRPSKVAAEPKGETTMNETNVSDPRTFAPPYPKSRYLWRFIGARQKLPTLLDGGLWFSRVDEFHITDGREGSLPKENYGLFAKFPYAAEYLQGEYDRLPVVSYAVCWHMSDGDPNPELWEEFCFEGDGIAIRTTPDIAWSAVVPLNKEATGPFYFGEVVYVNHSTYKVQEKNFMEPLFIVTEGFRRENEARMLAYLPGLGGEHLNELIQARGPYGTLLQCNPQSRSNPETRLRFTGGHNDGRAIVVPVNAKELIHEVLFDSRITPENREWVIQELAKRGLDDRARQS
jgi:hypothetical protein